MNGTRRTDNKCGSPAGYSRHRNRKEPICEACRVAHNAYNHELAEATKRIRATSRRTVRSP